MRIRTLLAAVAAACALSLVSASSAGAVVPRDGWGFGVADDDWNLNFSDPNDQGSIPYTLEDGFALLGPKVFRLQVDWNAASHPRLLHRAQMIIARARASGVQQILATIRRNPYTDAGQPAPDPVTYEIQVAQTVQALAQNVDVWGPANEPNGGISWLPGTAGAQKLAQYMSALEEIVSAWDPTASTTSPDFVDRKDLGSIAAYVNAYKNAGGTFGDYVAWHPYWGVHNKTLSTTNDLIGLIPAGKSIWVTEVGGFGRNLADGIDDNFVGQQNDKVAWMTGTLAGNARVARIYYYHVRGSSSSWDTGLVDPSGRPRSAWYTWCIAAHNDDFNHPDCRLPSVEPTAITRDGNRVTVVARNPSNNVSVRVWTAANGWGALTQLGGNLKGRPRVISWSAGHLDVYARGVDDHVYHRYLLNGQWSNWEVLGNQRITSDPVPVAWGNGRVDLFARGADGQLVHSAFDGQWQPWGTLGGATFVGNPGVFSWGPGHLGAFVRSPDGRLLQRYFLNGQWSAWDDLSTGWTMTSDPVPLSWGNGHVDVFARGTDGSLIHRWFGSSQWQPWENIGAGWKISTAPSPVSWGSGHLDVYARGTSGSLIHRWYGGSQWQSWENLGGTIQAQPAAVAVASGHLDVYGAGTDNAIWHRWYGGSQWHPWDTLGGF